MKSLGTVVYLNLATAIVAGVIVAAASGWLHISAAAIGGRSDSPI